MPIAECEINNFANDSVIAKKNRLTLYTIDFLLHSPSHLPRCDCSVYVYNSVTNISSLGTFKARSLGNTHRIAYGGEQRHSVVIDRQSPSLIFSVVRESLGTNAAIVQNNGWHLCKIRWRTGTG